MMPDVNNNDLSTGEVVYFPGGRASCCFTTAATKIIIRVWGGGISYQLMKFVYATLKLTRFMCLSKAIR
jgi:hypothetical protein